MYRAALVLLLAASGCATPLAPHMVVAARVPTATATHAKVVFLWPENSCERGGYYTVATRDGRFLGNVYPDTRLEAELEPGTYDFMAFNPLVEEAEGRALAADVAPLHAELLPNRSYFVRFAFGEWDARGPVRPFIARTRSGMVYTLCPTHEAALIALTPSSPEWPHLREWLDELPPRRATGSGGDAWLHEDPLTVESHRALAAAREHRLLPVARARATLRASDGVHVIEGARDVASAASVCAAQTTLCL